MWLCQYPTKEISKSIRGDREGQYTHANGKNLSPVLFCEGPKIPTKLCTLNRSYLKPSLCKCFQVSLFREAGQTVPIRGLVPSL